MREALAEARRALAGFRGELYRCLTARADELADVVLCADGPVRDLAGLPLVPGHRRGHGAVYDALNAGRAGIARLRRAVGRLPLPSWPDGRIRLAADVCSWLRPGAVTSPERIFCHVHGRGNNAGQMIPGLRTRSRPNPGDHRRVLPADHRPTALARLPLTCLSMGLNMFVQGFDAGDAAPMPSSAFDVFRPHVVLVRPEYNFWRVRTPDGDEADIYADVTPGTFGSLMISHFSVGGPLDLLAEFAIRASAVILTPGGPAMLTAEAQRQHLPGHFQHAAIVIRNGDDIRQALATF